MKKLFWANLLHIYQPPNWNRQIIRKVVREAYRPLCHVLLHRPRVTLTLNITASLTEQLNRQGYTDVLSAIKKLAKRKQIEFTGSAAYHPILPKLPPSEIERQIILNDKINRRYLGGVYKPTGFFAPEMCYVDTVAAVVKKLGFAWIALDEIAAEGTLGSISFDQRYLIKSNRLPVIFRNRAGSDIFFLGRVKTVDQFFTVVAYDNRADQYLITAMDGEIFGHHKKNMDRFLALLLDHPALATITYTDLLAQYVKQTLISPLPSSWSTQEEEMKNKNYYNLWANPENRIHQLQWQLTDLAVAEVTRQKKSINFRKARQLLDQTLASDQYWWASAQPWWHPPIIKRSARNFVLILDLIKSPRLIAGTKLAQSIVRLADLWQKTGLALTIKKNYLKKFERAGFFGGKRIS